MSSLKKNPDFNENESPVLRLFMRKNADGKGYLTLEQFKAADMLRRDFERSQMAPRMVASYREGVSAGSKHWQLSDNHVANLSDRAIAARENFHRALDAVGPELGGVLYQVCCLAAGLEQAERVLALPLRSGKAVLSLGLTRLARHYGLMGRAETRATGQWALPDFKAQIAPTPHGPRHQP
jgi:Domain of unknown function (DUF6456)